MEQYEVINLVGNDKPLVDAVDRSSKKLDGLESKAVSVNKAIGAAAEQSGNRQIAVATRTENSIERQVAALEKLASSVGKSPLEKLLSDQQIAVGRVRGYEEAVTRVNAAYQKLIDTQQRSDLAAAMGAATKKAAEFEAALKKVNAENRAVVSGAQQRVFQATATPQQRLFADQAADLFKVRNNSAAVAEVNAAYQKLNQAQAEANSLGSQFQNYLGSAAGRFLTVAGVAAIAGKAIHGIGEGIAYAIEQSQLLKNTENLFTSLFKSRSDAVGLRIDLINLSKSYPAAFDLSGAVKASELLASFKFTAKETVTVLDTLGRAGALGQDRIQRIGLAIGQIGAKGRLQGGEIRQLAEAGIGVTQSLAQALGQSSVEFEKTLEKGVIPAKESIAVILQSIRKEFGDSSQLAAKEVTGLANTIKLNLQLGAAGIGDVFDPFAKSLLSSLLPASRALENIQSIVGHSGPKFAGFFEKAAAAARFFLVDATAVGVVFQKLDDLANKPRQDAILKQLATGKTAKADAEARALKEAVAKNEAELAGKKAQEKAVENAKRNAEELLGLDAARLGALRQFLTGSSQLGSIQEKILNTNRQLADRGASQGQIFKADELIRTTGLLEDLSKKDQKAKELSAQASKKATQAVQENFAAELAIKDLQANIARDTTQRFAQLNERDDANRIQSQQASLQRVRDLELAQIDSLSTRTVAERISVTQKKLDIELAFQQSLAGIEDTRLRNARDKEIAFFNFARAAATDPAAQAAIDAQIEQVNKIFADERLSNTQKLISQETILRTQAASQISQIQITEQQRVFDFWKSSFNQTIDALFSTTKSFADRAKALLNSLIFAPLKEATSTALASIFTGQSAQSRAGGLFQGIFGRPAGGGPASQSSSAIGTIGAQTALAAILGGGNGIVPGFGSSTAPGGTPTFSGGSVTSAGGLLGRFGSLGGLFGGGGGATGGGGAFGGLGSIAGLGGAVALGGAGLLLGGLTTKNRALGSILTIGGGAALGTQLSIGGTLLGAVGGAGIGLAADGLRRGGLLGIAETTGGGAIIGARLGGPVGAAIGAGIGFVAGLVRSFFKGASDKTIDEIKKVYGVNVTDQGIIKQVIEIAKQSYGGNMPVAVRSAQVAELIQLYGMATGKYTSAISNVQRPVLFLQSGGSLYQQAQYAGSNAVSYQSPIPSYTPTYQLPSGNSGGNFTLQLDGDATERVLNGRVAEGLKANSALVADSAATGSRQNASRRSQFAAIAEPLTV